MNIRYLGTEYGGWAVDLDLIQDGDLIIDAGLGEDISFIEELQKLKKVKFVGIDPTEKSHKFLESKTIPDFELVKKAVAPSGVSSVIMHRNSNPNYVSESYFTDHGSVNPESSYSVEAVSLKDIISKHSPVLVKMDIEGAEYEVIDECIGVKQICVEFHHHCMMGKEFSDTQRCIDTLELHGYRVISSKNNTEFTFAKNEG